ncbi:Histone-lysine N-methyltransferase-like protein [Quillaja saponaria]|uniref:Histone-lysine N-methyltransferase-like protein n=1 Tax=Quillaja saponaria TaxID=32244 RepID=A0AAD7PT69_QUISA|nr:Histone-lysine N-methyltransferase-like protein [Quillaja saponaria]
MDNSWQMKCATTSQSPTSGMLFSASQEPMIQMEMNAGHYVYPFSAQDLRSKVVGGMQEPVCPSFLNSNYHGSGHTDGNSFLAHLSGSSSLLQCDFQESHLKAGENLSNQIVQPRGVTFPATVSREMASLSRGAISVLYDIQNSDLADAVVNPIIPGIEKAEECTSMGQYHGTRNFCSMDIQTMPNMESEANPSNQSSSFMRGCPRVFCFGESGYLLLSNTGLLGIVCSCHCFHMSVLKFCEHSGLRDVDPGDAVRMESGQTIAQWRKSYFLKFGVRCRCYTSEYLICIP